MTDKQKTGWPIYFTDVEIREVIRSFNFSWRLDQGINTTILSRAWEKVEEQMLRRRHQGESKPTLVQQIIELLNGLWRYGATIDQLASITNIDPESVRAALGEIDFHGLESNAATETDLTTPVIFWLKEKL